MARSHLLARIGLLCCLALSVLAQSDKLVFCHFMIGIVGDRTTAADYDDDMRRAKSLGIDAFALNIGTDSYTDTQLNFAYESAANNGMKVFISFDFNWYHDTSDASVVGQKIAQYGSRPAQLMVDGKVFASSFAGDQLNVPAMRSAAGVPVFWAPNVHPEYGTSFANVDGALNWMAWDNDGNNKAPKPGADVTVAQGDSRYVQALAGKPYIAPVSPWFFTHFGPEVSYSKNWVFPGDLLWYHRWNEILSLKPRFIEIITWNDYGESHYIGPLKSKHYDDGNSKWTNDMPHAGWLDMSKPYIAAFKADASDVTPYITEDELVYWYRPTLRDLNCDATDTTLQDANNGSGNYFKGRPDGWQTMSDSVFVVSLLKSAGQVSVSSGGNTQTFNAPAGAAAWTVPMGVGQQKFALQRNGATVMSATSLKDVSNVCPCGLYNFNAYVGTLTCSGSGEADPLGADGLASLTIGLKVSTCQAKPTLGSPLPGSCNGAAAPTTTSRVVSPSTSAPATRTTTSTTQVPVTSIPVTTTFKTTTAAATTTKACGRTITASSQIFPTNCLQQGDVWQGPAGQGKPDKCDGAGPCIA
ncbi:hypothetical protein PMIN03_008803 [Paraphaeosphaeria minitans]